MRVSIHATWPEAKLERLTGEAAGDKVDNFNQYIEFSIGGDVLPMAGECNQGRDHVGGRGNIAHDDTTAGATLDLETVG